jgi:hypothetical protein
MYLALFLSPWILMYGLSTAAMNHRDFLKDLHDGPISKYERITELRYEGPTRVWGWVALLSGVVMFIVFLLNL